ncbi:HEAT repeat domain-containing protein [bacterium]|nr:HEAT repeat domain-containing protein [bacterium]
MANKIKIFKNIDNTYVVQAISIKKGNDKFFVPSPFGKETMIFSTLEDAITQINKCGYGYSITETEITTDEKINNDNTDNIEYDKIVEVLIQNLGHENLEIRNTAINSLAKFNFEIADRLVEMLETDNHWLVQQSIVKCIERIIENNKNLVSVFVPSLIKISNSDNTMVKSAALKAIEKICDLKNNS